MHQVMQPKLRSKMMGEKEEVSAEELMFLKGSKGPSASVTPKAAESIRVHKQRPLCRPPIHNNALIRMRQYGSVLGKKPTLSCDKGDPEIP